MVQTRRGSQVAAITGTESNGIPESNKHVASKTSGKRTKRERVKEDDNIEPEAPVTEVKKRRKKTHDSEPSKPADFPKRVSSLWKMGAHVSTVGGIENAPINAASIGANAFALFVKSQRRWVSPPLTSEAISTFKSRVKEFGYSPTHILPHGSYLINLGNPDEEKREKAYQCFLDDLQRCEQLGLELYNFHPGSTVGKTTKENSISLIAACINRAHKATSSVTAVIETMAGGGNIIGATFKDLGDIIQQVDNKSRIGVCIDTCHIFAAGYDIKTKEGWNSTMAKFDEQVGLSYLRGFHINDSKEPFASKRDRHANIGLGCIGIDAFRHIVTDPRTQNFPLILETPSFESNEVWTSEIAALNKLSDGEVEDDQLKTLTSEIRTVVDAHSTGIKEKKTQSRKSKNEEDHECNLDDD